jgi:glycolate oxidase iron-sulfur subunit
MTEIISRKELETCNGCGFCQAACPVYRLTRREGACARGHYANLKALEEGALAPEGELTKYVKQCLTCRACTANCPTSRLTDKIVVTARERLARAGKKARFSPYRIMSEPKRLLRWANWLRLGRGAKLLAKIPGMPQIGRRALEMLPGSGKFLGERLGGLNLPAAAGAGEAPIFYFMSCGMNYLCPEAGEATLKVLQGGGFQPIVLESGCCGLPAYSAGDLTEARKAAMGNLALFSRGEGPIVTDCASCAAFLKNYPELLGEEAEAFAARVMDFTEFAFSRWGEGGMSKEAGCSPTRIITYHEPCHLSRYQNLRDEPRALLKALPGVEFRELPEADWCCGGAGSYAVHNPELSLRILDRKMENLARTGADILVSACPSCLLQLASGVKRAKLPVKVMHLSQLLEEALRKIP